jgi:hypothetical protein
VENTISPFERFLQQREICNASMDNADGIGKTAQILRFPARKIINNNDFVGSGKRFDNMGPNKPRPSSDYVLHDTTHNKLFERANDRQS